MLRKLFVMMALATLVFPAMAMANFQTGDYEFTLSGSGSSDNDFNTNDFAAQASLGYFFTEQLEGLIRQEAGFTARDPGNDDWNGSTAVGADFHLDLEAWQPFVGASLGYLYGDDVDETLFAGPEVGIKAFVNTTTFVHGLVQYQFLFDSADEADNNFDDGRFVYALGLGVRW